MAVTIQHKRKASRNSTTVLRILGICLVLSFHQIYRSLSFANTDDPDDVFGFEEPRLSKRRPKTHYNHNHSRSQSNNNNRRQNVHIVVSHCDKSIGWIWKDFANDKRQQENTTQLVEQENQHYNLKSVSIITKCNVSIPSDDLPLETKGSEPPLVQVLSLPNVGRCDHSYAYWIKEVLIHLGGEDFVGGNSTIHGQTRESYYKLLYSNQGKSYKNGNPFQKIATIIDPADMVLFLKDNNNAYRSGGKKSFAVPEVLDQLAPDTPPIAATTYSELLESDFKRPITRGFSCVASTPNPVFGNRQKQNRHKFINLAHRLIMWDFKMEDYTRLPRDKLSDGTEFVALYRPMGNWIRHLHETQLLEVEPAETTSNQDLQQSSDKILQSIFSKEYYHRVTAYDIAKKVNSKSYFEKDLVPVCYGGIFATYWGQVASVDSPLTPYGWRVVAKTLSRGDNIEDGHYMERWWADLLSFSSWADQMVFQRQSSKSTKSNNNDTAFKNSSRVSGITLSEAEQELLLLDKLRYITSGRRVYMYAGLVALRRDVVEQRQHELGLAT